MKIIVVKKSTHNLVNRENFKNKDGIKFSTFKYSKNYDSKVIPF